MSVARKRLSVEDLVGMINEGFLRINRPDMWNSDYDPHHALKSSKVRMSSISSVCKRKSHYGERYPEMDLPDPKWEDSMKGVYRMVLGTLIHEGEFLAHEGEIKEVVLDVDDITGHCDIYLPKQGVVIDIKTTRWIGDDPHLHHVEQLEGYFAQLNKSGFPCYQLFLFYIDTCKPAIKLFEIVEQPLPSQPLELFDMIGNTERNVMIRNKSLDDIWDDALKIKDIYLRARKEGILPPPCNDHPQRKGHYLCDKFCPFRKRCIANSL